MGQYIIQHIFFLSPIMIKTPLKQIKKNLNLLAKLLCTHTQNCYSYKKCNDRFSFTPLKL